jgi:hypothetical protein
MHEGTLTLRPATEDDAVAVARLVELEEALPLTGDVLLAELDGYVIAAVSVREDHAVADIFRPTAELVAMLRTWRDALIRVRRFPDAGPAERPRGLRGLLTRRRARTASAAPMRPGDPWTVVTSQGTKGRST